MSALGTSVFINSSRIHQKVIAGMLEISHEQIYTYVSSKVRNLPTVLKHSFNVSVVKFFVRWVILHLLSSLFVVIADLADRVRLFPMFNAGEICKKCTFHRSCGRTYGTH